MAKSIDLLDIFPEDQKIRNVYLSNIIDQLSEDPTRNSIIGDNGIPITLGCVSKYFTLNAKPNTCFYVQKQLGIDGECKGNNRVCHKCYEKAYELYNTKQIKIKKGV